MMVIALIPAVGNVIKVSFMLVAVIGIIYTRRGSMYYSKANKKFATKDAKDIADGIIELKKAVKAGIPDNLGLAAGTIFLQHGELALGKEVLEGIISRKQRNVKIIYVAKISLSMAAWLEKDFDKAIILVEEVKAAGFVDRNLYINLCTYYLAKEDVQAFKKLVKEFKKIPKLHSHVLSDFEAVNAILNGEWAKAGAILKELFDAREYTFADPYMHLAQVKLHYGKVEEAITILNRSLDNCVFSSTAVIAKDVIDKVISGLKNPKTRDSYLASINKNPLDLINGKLPEIKTSTLEDFEEEPEYETIEKDEVEEETLLIDDTIIEEPNTSLSDDDEEWIKKHSN